jgi:hypothetical protein
MSEEKTAAEADQLFAAAGDQANAFLRHMVNGHIALKYGDHRMADDFLTKMMEVLKPLDELQLCCLIYELSQRLVAAMIETVGGDVDNLREAMKNGLVLGMTTNSEVAFDDLPTL